MVFPLKFLWSSPLQLTRHDSILSSMGLNVHDCVLGHEASLMVVWPTLAPPAALLQLRGMGVFLPLQTLGHGYANHTWGVSFWSDCQKARAEDMIACVEHHRKLQTNAGV